MALRANGEAEKVRVTEVDMRRASWKEVHGELTRLAHSKGVYDADEARWLIEGKRVRVHQELAYGSYLSCAP